MMGLLSLARSWLDRAAKRWHEMIERSEWDRRMARAKLLFPSDDQVAVDTLQNVKDHISRQLNYGETSASRLTRRRLDEFTFFLNALVLKRLLELRKLVGVQGLKGPVGLIFWMTTVADEPDDSGGRRLMLKVIKESTEAKSLKLQAKADMSFLATKPDRLMMQELTEALANEVASALISHVIGQLQAQAYRYERSYEAKTLESALGGDYVASALMKAANGIGSKTKRGAGNFVVVSPIMFERLSKSKAWNESVGYGTDLIAFRGKLHGLSVYTFGMMPDNQALIGFKGANETDCGAVLSPYLPVLLSQAVDPASYETVGWLMTRFGFKLLGSQHDPDTAPMVNGADYYATLELEVR